MLKLFHDVYRVWMDKYACLVTLRMTRFQGLKNKTSLQYRLLSNMTKVSGSVSRNVLSKFGDNWIQELIRR